ncbi:MAG: hypothetical protein IH598_01005 [Bacteroidales bacterium]|nr:hypothetical protein [Bacteroidales bacterium]
MKTTTSRLILPLLIFAMMVSCLQKQEYPDIPSLKYERFTTLVHPSGYDSAGVLLLSYTDGDGDLGIAGLDTSSYNFFVTYYQMENGVLKPGTRYNAVTGQYDTIFFNNRFYRLAPPGYTGWIKGEIEDTIKPLYDPRSTKTFDTVQYKIYMVDRAGNYSNTVETPLIIVKNPD